MIMKVPLVMGAGEVEVNIDDLPEPVYHQVVKDGLRCLINRGWSKIPYNQPREARHEQVKKLAQDNLRAMGIVKTDEAK